MHKSLLRNTAIAAIAATTLTVAAGSAFAEDNAKIDRMEQAFKKADKNSDGKLTKAEAENGMPRVAAHFDRIDKDKKGYITIDDLKAEMGSR